MGEITNERENVSSESSTKIATHWCYFFLFGLSNSLLVSSKPIPGIKKLQPLYPKTFRNNTTKWLWGLSCGGHRLWSLEEKVLKGTDRRNWAFGFSPALLSWRKSSCKGPGKETWKCSQACSPSCQASLRWIKESVLEKWEWQAFGSTGEGI